MMKRRQPGEFCNEEKSADRNETQELTEEEYLAFFAANPNLKPDYPNKFWGRLGLRPIFRLLAKRIEGHRDYRIRHNSFLGFIIWRIGISVPVILNWNWKPTDHFASWGQADDELTARRLGQKDLDELVAELNLLTGEFDIVRAR